jgi:hypothetical protein
VPSGVVIIITALPIVVLSVLSSLSKTNLLQYIIYVMEFQERRHDGSKCGAQETCFGLRQGPINWLPVEPVFLLHFLDGITIFFIPFYFFLCQRSVRVRYIQNHT